MTSVQHIMVNTGIVNLMVEIKIMMQIDHLWKQQFLEVWTSSLNQYDMSINYFDLIRDMVSQILLVLRESCMCAKEQNY